jgi:hypothetical protein
MGRSSADGWCRAHIDHESSDVHFPALMMLSAGFLGNREQVGIP